MRERAPHEEQEQPPAAAKPAPARHPAAMALQMQQAAGNRATATYYSVPPEWRQLAIDNAHSKDAGNDAKFLEIGIKRLPSCWVGGWIIGQAGDGTHAITLDTDVWTTRRTGRSRRAGRPAALRSRRAGVRPRRP